MASTDGAGGRIARVRAKLDAKLDAVPMGGLVRAGVADSMAKVHSAKLDRNTWIVVGAIMLIGLAMRVAASQGALWLDEAWSAVMAHDVKTPLGVFLNINHDNNHHLNTLWLQLVGMDASPMVQRGLSIISGTMAIPIAARIGARQSPATAIFAALLFAISPVLVTYGSEARGYAPMVLALLIAVQLVAHWLDDTESGVRFVKIGLTVFHGMLAQLTFVFGLAAIAVWAVWTLLRDEPRQAALRKSARVLLPIALPALGVLVMVFGAAIWAGTGLQFGKYEPFHFDALVAGVTGLLTYTVGSVIAFAAAALVIAPIGDKGQWSGEGRLFLIALALPLLVVLFQIGNSGEPRYHLIVGLGLLMLLAFRAGQRFAEAGYLRWLVLAGLGVVGVASAVADARIIADKRADPGMALQAITARVPQGADVAVDRPRATPVLRAMAASAHYQMTVVETPCPATRFLFIDRDGKEPFPEHPERCGAHYRAIAEAHPGGLSGTHWKLYERLP